MRTIAITNQKANCGKTITAVNLAAALAKKGKRTLLVDLDPQAQATVGLGLNPQKLTATVYDILAGTEATITRVIKSTDIPSLDILPGSILLAGAELQLCRQIGGEFILSEQLRTVGDDYDVCIIDCPSSLGPLTLTALVASTDCIVPVEVGCSEVGSLNQLLQTVDKARQQFHPCSVKVRGLLLNLVDSRTNLSRQLRPKVRKAFGDLTLSTVIHRTATLAETLSAAQPILTYAPRSKGTAEFKALAEEINNGQ